LIFFLSFTIIEASSSKCAFVTLIYESNILDGKGFVQGAQVLAYSLKKTNTKHDLVAMVTDQVGPYHRELLINAGWKLHEMQSIKNHNTEYASRFDYIFTKLKIFTLMEYQTIVYLDADTMVTENIDQLCSCPSTKYCAAVRSTFFNAGVMVVKPNMTLFQDMSIKSTYMHSNEGGDQGFLNNYFWNTEECPFYDFSSPKKEEECFRIPGYYNGDVALYVAKGDKWEFDPLSKRTRPAIIHYTMSFLKPWNWISYLFISECWRWWDMFSEMEAVNSWFGTTSCLLAIACLFAFHFMVESAFKYVKFRTPVPISFYSAVVIAILAHLVALFFALVYSTLTFLTPLGDALVFCTAYVVFLDIFYSKILIDIFLTNLSKKADHRDDWRYVCVFLFLSLAISIILGLLNIFRFLIFRIILLVVGIIIIPIIVLVSDATQKFTPTTSFLLDDDGSELL
jgi:lipopolysaccharide biosynthesis glycosyltransferase